jgi:hypothetical protein
MFNTQIIIVAKSSSCILNIEPRTRTSTNQIIATFKNKEKRPNVNIFKGKVNIFNTGFTIKLIIPSINPARAKDERFPSKTTPGIPVASHIPIIATII